MLKGGESSVSTYLASKNGELGCQVVVVPYLGKGKFPRIRFYFSTLDFLDSLLYFKKAF